MRVQTVNLAFFRSLGKPPDISASDGERIRSISTVKAIVEFQDEEEENLLQGTRALV